MSEHASIELIGVRFDGMGRAGGQANAPEALRAAGLGPALAGCAELGEDTSSQSEPQPWRASGDGFLNQAALIETLLGLHERLAHALAAVRFPIVYGADCAVLLAALPASREVLGPTGLVFIDAHEDATPLGCSESGEAANMQIGLLCGLGSGDGAERLPVKLPAVRPEAVAMLGQRDEAWRAPLGISSVGDELFLRSADDVARDPARAAAEAAAHVKRATPRWWMHIDFDVLDKTDFPACGAPGEPSLSGGLHWDELDQLASSALAARGCCGLSVVVYNPDLDPYGAQAERIVKLLAKLAPALQPSSLP